ncbi:MAG: uridine diphosphate-N-acetylglucosamine-binding protein YvcK, partial [Actinobacteria bacterium]|nr:uridine diphosphate-N-acetylglucosamine-binding protein YvcK [Actinomycetota bacterium]
MTASPPGTAPAGREGPRVVALGGGHGTAVTLQAVRRYAGDIAAIVSVADDGGSSGRLRAVVGVPAPGYGRRCLSALAADDTLLARSLEHRFEGGPLHGHALGNLLLAGLTLASGDFVAAVEEVGRLVGAQGALVPATAHPVTLVADSDAGTLDGQVTIERATGICDLRFHPADPPAPSAAIDAIECSTQVVLGPGSLFTSVLATAVLPDLRDALART